MASSRQRSLLTGLVLGVVAIAASRSSAQAPAEKTPYDRLGGLDGVAVLVDRLVDRMAADETLQGNPYVKEAMARVPAAGLKYRITTMLAAATGGPQQYSGRSMQAAHAHLRITGREWRAFLALVNATFDALEVGELERADVLSVIQPAMPEIVNAGELDGRSFASGREGTAATGGELDEVSFAAGRLVRRSDAGRGVPPLVYFATPNGDAVDFEAAAVAASGENVSWKGTVNAGTLAATVTWSAADGTKQISRFEARAAE